MALSNNYLLLSNEIVVYTDHQALVSISQKHSMLDKRILKFLKTLSTYPVVIKYLPGKKNHADFLSRFCVDKQPELKLDVLNNEFNAVRVTRFAAELENPFSRRNQKLFNGLVDDDLKRMLMLLKSNGVLDSRYNEVKNNFQLINDELKFVYENKIFSIIKIDECMKLFAEWHAKFHGFPIVLLKNCKHCDLFISFKSLPAPVQKVKTPQFGELWHIDFIGPVKGMRVHPTKYLTMVRYMLVCVEYVSSYCFAAPTNSTESDTVCMVLN